jgi:hypothetical protein
MEDRHVEVVAMLPGSQAHSNVRHLVPCVIKAVQIMDALRTDHSGLRVEDFVVATGYARSTVYRILRTLMACNYVRRDSRGTYHLNQGIIGAAARDAWTGPNPAADASNLAENGGHLEFERWGVRFRCGGTRAPARHGAGTLAANQIEA